MDKICTGAATAHGIARIAQDAGFYDHSSFVKRFTGTTPLRYRREQQAALKADRTIALPPKITAG